MNITHTRCISVYVQKFDTCTSQQHKKGLKITENYN